MNYFTKLKLFKTSIFVLLLLCSITYTTKAQCPVGETEVTISFDTSETYNYYDYQIENALWNYVTQGVASDAGPFSLLDTVTICIPNGDVTITGCGDSFAWWLTPIKAVITEDGSVNGCSNQNGCELYYDPFSWYFYDLNGECDDLPTTPIITFPVGCNNSIVDTVGCTNPDAPNYNPCAVEDDGTCQLENTNSFCENALPIEFNGCDEQNILVNIESNTFSGLLPSCATNTYSYPDTIPNADIFYELVIPESGNIKIQHYASDGIAIYDGCTGNEIYCEVGFNNTSIISGLPAGETVILQFWKFMVNNFEFCIEALPGSANNDLCENAVNLCGQIAEGTTTDAFPQENDPELSCTYGYNPNSVWYSFTTNESNEPVSIFIEPTMCELYFYFYDDFKDGLNAGIYQGTCGDFTLLDCTSYISPNTNNYILEIQDPLPNETYYIYVANKDYTAYCDFNISTSSGINNCCELDISLNTVCESTDAEEYYVDIEISDFGSNTSGFMVNNGDFQNISSTGTTQIGPFSNRVTAVTLQSINDADCLLTYKVLGNCNMVTNNDCSNPLPVNIETDNICSDVDYIEITDPGTFSGLIPNCYNGYTTYNFSDDLFYEVIVPSSGSIKINIEYANVALYSSCDLQSIACSERNYQYWFDNLTPEDTLIVQFWRDEPTPFYSFCIEEVPSAPNEDFCENAITLCGALVNAETGTSTISDTDPFHSCEDQYSYDNNVWYTFTSDESGLPITVNLIDDCKSSNYGGFSDGFVASVYEGSCGELTEIDCFSIYGNGYYTDQTNDIHQLEVVIPNPNTTYYLMLSGVYGSDCSFEIFTSTGIENCCNANYTVTPICEAGEEDQFYVEIEMNDLGDNPSGYSINDGAFPDILSTGITVVGPFTEEDITITLTGLNTSCELYHPVFINCTISPLNSTCENAELYDLKPFGSCDYAFNYYWDVYNTNNASLSLQPSCIGENQANNYFNLFYQVVVPNSGIIHFFSFQGNLAVYDSCLGNELLCVYDTRDGYTIDNLTPGDTLIFQILSSSEQVDFCIQEQPNTPINDLCERAIPLCEGTFSGHNINATTSNDDAFSACNNPQNTVWYSFEAQSNESVSFELYTSDCINYFGGSYGDMIFSIFSGNCGGPYVEEFCGNFAVFDRADLEFENPVAGQQYLVQISGEDLQCSFDITVSETVKPCCEPDITLTPTCPNGIEDAFYVDITVNDLGENPSGFIVNGGEFPDIISTGVTIVGPFSDGEINIVLEGKDLSSCTLVEQINHFCDCSGLEEFQFITTSSIFLGQYKELKIRYPNTTLPYDCEVNWVTDLNDPVTSLIGIGDTIIITPDIVTTISIFAIADCSNDLNCPIEYQIEVIDPEACQDEVTGSLQYKFPYDCPFDEIGITLFDRDDNIIESNPEIDEYGNYTFSNGPYPCDTYIKVWGDCIGFPEPLSSCSNATVLSSSGIVLSYGDYYNFTTELSITLADTATCEFLYWVTDLTNPQESIISTEENYIVATPAGSQTNYYGIISCNDVECIEAVTVFTPILDYYYPGCCDPINPHYYYYYPDEPDDTGDANGVDGTINLTIAEIQCPENNTFSVCAPVSISSPMTLEDFNPGEDASFMNSMSLQLYEQIDVQQYYTTTKRIYTLEDETGNQKTCETKYHIANQFMEAPKDMQPNIVCEEDLWSHFKAGPDKYKIYADDNGFMGEEMSICDTEGSACSTFELGVNTNESNTYNFWVTTFFEFPDGSICESTPAQLNVKVKAKPVAQLDITQQTIAIGESISLMDVVSVNKNGEWFGLNIIYANNLNNESIAFFSPNKTGVYKLYYTVTNDFCESSYLLLVDVVNENSPASKSILSENFENDVRAVLNIYPNPATDKVFINFLGEGDYNIRLMDISGKIIKQIEIANYQEDTITIDVDKIDKGIYFIELKNAYNKTIQKLIVD